MEEKKLAARASRTGRGLSEIPRGLLSCVSYAWRADCLVVGGELQEKRGNWAADRRRFRTEFRVNSDFAKKVKICLQIS